MTILYVTSTSPNSGKTAVAVALGQHYQQQGKRVGWFKPVSTTVTPQGNAMVDQDAIFVREALNLSAEAQALSPFALTSETVREILESGNEVDHLTTILEQARRMAEGTDLLIVEGGTTIQEGAIFNLDAARIAEGLDARVLIVARWESVLVADELLAAKQVLGERLIGVILNAVPRSRADFAESVMRGAMAQRGVPILATIPTEPLLSAMSVRELADVLSANVLTAHENQDVLVENLSVGAMSVDSALRFFRRKANQAVITGGDRADIQLAALETSTRCLILTGGLPPSPIILSHAEEVGVPILVVPHDTLTTVEITERYFGKIRFHQAQKLERFTRLIADRLDFGTLDQALGF